MSIHIWCPRASDSAIKLRDALITQGIAAYKSTSASRRSVHTKFFRRIKPGDLWVNWGPAYSVGLETELNAVFPLNKRDQLLKLEAAGIPCPKVYTQAAEGRIGRSFNHQGGKDLLYGTGRDFYAEKFTLDHEVRIHIFNGLSIRAGVKVKRPGFPEPHEWIRSYNAGWKIDYSLGSKIKQDRRELAKNAVKALGLDFGAVDIGVTPRGKPVVLEVNLAPGLDEGGSVNAYVQHLIQVHNGGELLP